MYFFHVIRWQACVFGCKDLDRCLCAVCIFLLYNSLFTTALVALSYFVLFSFLCPFCSWTLLALKHVVSKTGRHQYSHVHSIFFSGSALTQNIFLNSHSLTLASPRNDQYICTHCVGGWLGLRKVWARRLRRTLLKHLLGFELSLLTARCVEVKHVHVYCKEKSTCVSRLRISDRISWLSSDIHKSIVHAEPNMFNAFKLQFSELWHRVALQVITYVSDGSENGGDVFLRKIGNHVLNYRASHPEWSTCLQLLVGVLSPAPTLLLRWRAAVLRRLLSHHGNGLLVVPAVVCSYRLPVDLLGLRRGVRLPQEEQRLRSGRRRHRVAAHHVFLVVLIYRGCLEPLGRRAPYARIPRHWVLLGRRPSRQSLSVVISALSLFPLFLRCALRKRDAHYHQQHKQLHPTQVISFWSKIYSGLQLYRNHTLCLRLTSVFSALRGTTHGIIFLKRNNKINELCASGSLLCQQELEHYKF